MDTNDKPEGQTVPEENLENADTKKEETKPKGSGIFTVDGKELPAIEGGYTFYHGGGTIGENNLK